MTAMTRLDSCFSPESVAARGGRAALVAYVMVGDPDIETSFRILSALRENGADVIELGVPFSDPIADGPAIQRAGQRALAAGVRLGDVFALAQRFRREDTKTPLVLMGYANPIHAMGVPGFARNAGASGIDAILTVDLPPEEDAHMLEALDQLGISVIRLVTPTTGRKRLGTVLARSSGFVYYVSVTGVTGAGIGDYEAIAAGVGRVREWCGHDGVSLPVAVGFGVRSPQQAARLARFSDAVVVGSAFVRIVQAGVEAGEKDKIAQRAGQFAAGLVAAMAAS